MTLNESFLYTLTRAFKAHLGVDAKEKAKILHTKIADDLASKFGAEFKIDGDGGGLSGRYYGKDVNIAICKNGVKCAGINVKFAINNYLKNRNSYFEMMLGNAANFRSNNLLYFQILIVPVIMPHFESLYIFPKYLEISHLKQYQILSNDNPDTFFHTPNKTLLVVVRLPELFYDHDIIKYDEYKKYCEICRDEYKNKFCGNKELYANEFIQYSHYFSAEFGSENSIKFGEGVILNDYELFLDKVYHRILAK